jgi:predicted nuclease with TOPRIM domain
MKNSSIVSSVSDLSRVLMSVDPSLPVYVGAFSHKDFDDRAEITSVGFNAERICLYANVILEQTDIAHNARAKGVLNEYVEEVERLKAENAELQAKLSIRGQGWEKANEYVKTLDIRINDLEGALKERTDRCLIQQSKLDALKNGLRKFLLDQ